jgi:hypothetical protein
MNIPHDGQRVEGDGVRRNPQRAGPLQQAEILLAMLQGNPQSPIDFS